MGSIDLPGRPYNLWPPRLMNSQQGSLGTDCCQSSASRCRPGKQCSRWPHFQRRSQQSNFGTRSLRLAKIGLPCRLCTQWPLILMRNRPSSSDTEHFQDWVSTAQAGRPDTLWRRSQTNSQTGTLGSRSLRWASIDRRDRAYNWRRRPQMTPQQSNSHIGFPALASTDRAGKDCNSKTRFQKTCQQGRRGTRHQIWNIDPADKAYN